MKKIISLFILSVLFIITSCKKNISEGEKYSIKYCKKMVECSQKMIEQIPESKRKEFEKRMPTIESCVKKSPFMNSKTYNIKFSAEEIKNAGKCIDAISKASCETAFSFSAPECNDFKQNLRNKKSHTN